MGETVDVLVVGQSPSAFLMYACSRPYPLSAGNYGTGRRAGGVSTLICAVLNDRQTASDGEPR